MFCCALMIITLFYSVDKHTKTHILDYHFDCSVLFNITVSVYLLYVLQYLE